MSRRPRPTLIAAVAVGVVLALLFVLLFTRQGGRRDQDTAPIVGKLAPAINGELLMGPAVDLTKNDRWTVVNFFATWCAPCVVEHPELIAFAKEHAKTGDARVVSVVYNEDPAIVEEFFRARGGDWSVYDRDEGRTAFDYGVTMPPETYVIAPTGVVVQRIRGGVTQRGLDAIIDQYDQAATPDTEGAGS